MNSGCFKFSLLVMAFHSPILTFGAEGFFRPTDALPAAPAGLDAMIRSSAYITDSAGGECSGTFVSGDGYVLTAAHCVAEQLLGNGSASVVAENGMKWIHFDRAKVIGQKLTGVHFPTVLAGAPVIVDIGDEIIRKEDSATDLPEGYTTGAHEDQDYVLLKIDIARKPLECLPLSRAAEPLPVNTSLWAIGYPGHAERSNGHSANGSAQYLTLGKTLKNFSESRLVREGMYGPEAARIVQNLFFPKPYAVTDLDGFSGMSGGGVVEAQGSLVGMIVGGLNTAEFYSEGTQAIIQTSWLRSQVRRNLGADAEARIFKCGGRDQKN